MINREETKYASKNHCEAGTEKSCSCRVLC